ncbi:MAG: HK97 gp10 family phage protein [Devosiaceae bacterium]|nr:HK97 gp10 family phage protein [Devosiaceae bacterium MH13]
MAERFSATVERWAHESEERLEAVFKMAVQMVLDEVINRTPVDTGFLRASAAASTTGFAPLVDGRGVVGQTYQVDAYEVVISGSELGDTIFFNFTANYAVYVENGARGRAPVGMVKLSAQNWQSYVDRAVAQLRAQ